MSVVVHVVDDDSLVRDSLAALLTACGVDVREYASGNQFLDSYRPNDDEVVLLDVRMPGADGVEVLTRLREEGVNAHVIMMTGHAEPHDISRCYGDGVLAFLDKPFDPERLLELIFGDPAAS